MMYSTIISQLGFKCHPISRTLRIISPFAYCDGGEHVGASVREINGRYLASDRCDALMNIGTRGISLTKERPDEIRQLLLKKGAELDAREGIIAWATGKDVDAITSNTIRTGILASTLPLDRYQPVRAEKPESMVIDYLHRAELRDAFSLRENVYGLSGHQATVPVTIKTDIPKYVFTSSMKHEGGWNSAYSLLGKLIDPRAPSERYSNRFVIMNNEVIGDQMQQLSLLFYESSQVLPFFKGETRVKRLAA